MTILQCFLNRSSLYKKKLSRCFLTTSQNKTVSLPLATHTHIAWTREEINARRAPSFGLRTLSPS